MKTIRDAVSVYQEFSVNDRTAFYLTLSDLAAIDKNSLEEILVETRFREGVYCPHCGTSHIVKNGKRKDGTQRYLCRECSRSFLASTHSIVSGTRKKPEIWKKYLHCMMEGKTLKSTAEECGISITTAFFWRHKILDALNKTSEKISLKGTVEAEETYLPVSYKGNHSRSIHFTMPRPARKRGLDLHTSGHSFDQACVLCASDRQEMQRINDYHGRLKDFLRSYHGVSTKYLGNYLTWHNLMFCTLRKGKEREEILWAAALAETVTDKCREMSQRDPVPVLQQIDK